MSSPPHAAPPRVRATEMPAPDEGRRPAAMSEGAAASTNPRLKCTDSRTTPSSHLGPACAQPVEEEMMRTAAAMRHEGRRIGSLLGSGNVRRHRQPWIKAGGRGRPLPAHARYCICRYSQPFVWLLLPLTTQFALGYDTPTTLDSTAFPISSSLVVMMPASARRIFCRALARFQSRTSVLDVLSRPPVRLG